jgi:hypothetical protein
LGAGSILPALTVVAEAADSTGDSGLFGFAIALIPSEDAPRTSAAECLNEPPLSNRIYHPLWCRAA